MSRDKSVETYRLLCMLNMLANLHCLHTCTRTASPFHSSKGLMLRNSLGTLSKLGATCTTTTTTTRSSIRSHGVLTFLCVEWRRPCATSCECWAALIIIMHKGPVHPAESVELPWSIECAMYLLSICIHVNLSILQSDMAWRAGCRVITISSSSSINYLLAIVMCWIFWLCCINSPVSTVLSLLRRS